MMANYKLNRLSCCNDQSNMKVSWVKKALKYFAYIVCTALFLNAVYRTVAKYLEQPTATSVQIELRNYIEMPGMTFCSSKAFKTKGDHYKEEDFNANVYKLEEIFGGESLALFRNTSRFKVTETRSKYNGLCHTIIDKINDYREDGDTLIFDIRKDNDVKVFVHEPGDEFWLIGGYFPRPAFEVVITTKSNPLYSFADLRLKLSESTIVNKVNT